MNHLKCSNGFQEKVVDCEKKNGIEPDQDNLEVSSIIFFRINLFRFYVNKLNSIKLC